MDKLKIYCKYLIVNAEQINSDIVDNILETSTISITYNNVLHKITFIENENFFNIYIEYGAAKPWPDHVINANTNENEENPRSIDQIEPKQMFITIDINKSHVWISSIKKAGILDYIFRKFGLSIELKNIYNTKDFIEKLSSINGIKLSSTPESLFKLSKLNEMLDYDVYGYGANSATLELKYKKSKKIDGKIINNLKDLFNQRESFDSFIISGIDDGNMNVVFNNESLVKKIFLDTHAKDTGEYDLELVFHEMNNKIGRIE